MADQFYFEDGYIQDGYFGYVADASANLSASASFTADGAIADTTGYYIPDYIADDYFESGVTIVEASASLTASAALTATPAKLFSVSSTLNSTFSMIVAPLRSREGAANLAVAAGIDTTPGVIKQSTANLNSAFTTTATAGAQKDSTANLNSAFTTTATAGTIKTASVAILSAMSFTALANVLKNHTAILDSQANLSASVEKIASSAVTLSNIVNLNLQAAKTTANDAALSASFDLTGTPTFIEIADATLASAFTVAVEGFNLSERPRLYTEIGSPSIDNTIFKFGSGSALLGADGGASGSLEIPPSTDYNTWETIDFQLQPETSGFGVGEQFVVLEHGESGDSEYFYVWVTRLANDGSDTRYNIRIRTRIGGSNYTYASSPILNWNTFKHIRIERASMHLWVDGVKDTPTSDTSTGLYPTNTKPITFGGGAGLISSSARAYIDELWITSDLLVNPSQTTFAPPTSEYELTEAQQTNTILLSHFNTDFSDYTGALEATSAGMQATATVTASITYITNNSAALAASAQLNSEPTYVAAGQVDITNAASFSVDFLSLNQTSAALNTTATLAASADIVQVSGANLNSAVGLDCAVEKFTGVSASFSAAASLSTNKFILIPDVNWLPRRSAFVFDNSPYSDLISTDGVTGTGVVINFGYPGTGYGTPIPTADARSFAYGSGSGGLIEVERTTGEYNTNIGTNDFALDVFVHPYGDDSQFHPIITFHNSTDNFSFGYQYDPAVPQVGGDTVERFSWIVQENGSAVAQYFYDVNTNTSEWQNKLYEPGSGTYTDQFGNEISVRGWQWFRIKRINGALTIEWRDLVVGLTIETIISLTRNGDFGSGYQINDSLSSLWNFYIDLVMLQIDSPEWPLDLQYTPTVIPGGNTRQNYIPHQSSGAAFDPRFTLTADFLRVSFGTINASVSATLELEPTRIRPFSSDLAASATVSAEAVKITTTNSSIASAVTQTTTAVKTTDIVKELSTVAQLNADVKRTRDNDINASAAATLSSDPARTRNPGSISENVSATIACDAHKIVRTPVALDGVLAFNTVARARYIGEIELDTSATVASSPVKKTGAVVEAQTRATVSATGFNTVDYTATISAAASIAVDAKRILPGTTDMSVSSTVTVAVVQLKGSDVFAAYSATLAATATRIQPNDSGLNTEASLTVLGDRVRFADSSLSVAFDPFYANAYRAVQAECELSAFVVSVTAGDVIAIDPYRTLLIEEETRRFKISQEDRNLTVEQETRVLEI